MILLLVTDTKTCGKSWYAIFVIKTTLGNFI